MGPIIEMKPYRKSGGPEQIHIPFYDVYHAGDITDAINELNMRRADRQINREAGRQVIYGTGMESDKIYMSTHIPSNSFEDKNKYYVLLQEALRVGRLMFEVKTELIREFGITTESGYFTGQQMRPIMQHLKKATPKFDAYKFIKEEQRNDISGVLAEKVTDKVTLAEIAESLEGWNEVWDLESLIEELGGSDDKRYP